MAFEGYYVGEDRDAVCEICVLCFDDRKGLELIGDDEQDSPLNCRDCGRRLRYSLTTEGVSYVLEAVAESLNNNDHRFPGRTREDPPYYEGSPHYAVVQDWAEDLQWYHLKPRDKALVDAYLALIKIYEAGAKPA